MILRGNARSIPLASDCVQAVITSPPYWALRKYTGEQVSVWGPRTSCYHVFMPHGRTPHHPDRGTEGKTPSGSGRIGGKRNQKSKVARGVSAQLGETCAKCGSWRGSFGLEPSIEMYVQHTIEILAEVWRVLRPDGVVFWNVGDSYAAGKPKDQLEVSYGRYPSDGFSNRQSRKPDFPLKPKDLCLIPHRIAIAAQAWGWWVRSIIVWSKPNPMPESCKDRPTDSYELVLMFTKSRKYFWDPWAVMEPSSSNTHGRGTGDGGPKHRAKVKDGIQHSNWAESTREVLATRNLRNVWEFVTQPYKGAHFATFPEELPRRCILAATSERGACARCGAPYKRIVKPMPTSGKSWNTKDLKDQGVNRNQQNEFAGKEFYKTRYGGKHHEAPRQMNVRRLIMNVKKLRDAGGEHDNPFLPGETVGWVRTCSCKIVAPAKPCVVLDPFAGSGTTGKVAIELNRSAVLLDLSYHDHADKRTRNVQRRLALA